MNRAISLPILTMLLTVFAFNSGKATAAEGFISVIDDLPLMAGLVEVKGSALVFSTPQGRIAEVSAKGTSGNAARPKKLWRFMHVPCPSLAGKQRAPPTGCGRRTTTRGRPRQKNTLIAQFSLTPK